MKQNSAEQPYEAYERLKKELEDVNAFLDILLPTKNSIYNFHKVIIKKYWCRGSRKIHIPKCLIPSLIESAESKKQQIENELNNLVNGQ
jgi:hypothetical protein